MPLPYPLNPLSISGAKAVPLTFTAVEPSTVKLSVVTGSPTVSGLHYRLGTSGTWLPYTIDTEIPIAPGDAVQFWNSASSLNDLNNTAQFAMSGGIEASGVLESLLNWSPSVGRYAYTALFRGATALLSVPVITASIVDNRSFYQTFENCSNASGELTLPAVTPANNCYQQIAVQSKITSVHVKLQSLANYCLFRAFRFCASLSRIEVDFTSWGAADLTQPTYQWVAAVADSGTFVKPANLPEEYGVDRIPTGWNVINK